MTKNEFFTKLKNARSRVKLVQRLESELLDGLDLEDVPFDGKNSTNLAEAISCYIFYGELPLSGNLEDFWEPYKINRRQRMNDEILGVVTTQAFGDVCYLQDSVVEDFEGWPVFGFSLKSAYKCTQSEAREKFPDDKWIALDELVEGSDDNC